MNNEKTILAVHRDYSMMWVVATLDNKILATGQTPQEALMWFHRRHRNNSEATTLTQMVDLTSELEPNNA